MSELTIESHSEGQAIESRPASHTGYIPPRGNQARRSRDVSHLALRDGSRIEPADAGRINQDLWFWASRSCSGVCRPLAVGRFGGGS